MCIRTGKLTEILVDHTFEVDAIQNKLLHEGFSKLHNYIFTSLNIPTYYTEVEEIVNTSKTRPQKAIEQWLYKEHKFKLSKKQKVAISNIMSEWKVTRIQPKTFTITPTKVLDWEHGTYGDEDSCWFVGSYSNARSALVGNGGFALTSDDTSSRCFILPLQEVVTHHGVRPALEPAYILFNSYGQLSNQYFTSYFIQILGKLVGLPFSSSKIATTNKTTAMTFNESTKSLIHLKRDQRVVDRITKHTVCIEIQKHEYPMLFFKQEPSTYCDCCGEAVFEDELVWALDQHYCEACADNQLFRCDSCCEWYSNDDRYEHENGSLYCETCSQDYSWCEDCGNLCDTIYEVVDIEGYFCEDCVGYHGELCCECSDYSSNYVEVHNEIVCNTCVEEGLVIMCPVCQDTIRTCDAEEVDDTYVCSECVESYEKEYA